MEIRNALVYCEDHKFRKGTIEIQGERISRVRTAESEISSSSRMDCGNPGGAARTSGGSCANGSGETGTASVVVQLDKGVSCANGSGETGPASADASALDAHGLYAIPGLVDVHFHGADGCDFCDGNEESIDRIARYEAEHGVLAICPATMTFSEEKLMKVMRAAAAHKNGSGADLVGIHMEGPFVSPKKLGAQNPAFAHAPDIAMVRRLAEAADGLLKIVDIAPELPGAKGFIREISKDIVISVSHTCADYETTRMAFKSGASHLTHTFNAMPGIHHRAPGPIPAALEAGADAELIADGVHIHPSIVRLAFRLFGEERMILISDSMEATGLPDGTYSLGGQAVIKRGRRAALASDPDTIAGSVTNLFDCMKTAVLDMKVPLETAVRAAAENPARSIGIEKDYGSIAPGRYANVVLMDREMNVRGIVQRGRLVKLDN